jgi:hypothetical protein
MSDLKQKLEQVDQLIQHIDSDQEQFQDLFNECIDHFNAENEVNIKDIELFDEFLVQALEDIKENSNYVSCFINEVSDHLLDKANENGILYHPEFVINTLDQLTAFANDNSISCDYIVQGMTWLSSYDDDTISQAHIKVSENTFDYFIHVDPSWGVSAITDRDDIIKLIEYNDFEGIDSFKNGIQVLAQHIEKQYKEPETLGYVLNHFINEGDGSNSNLKLIDTYITPILHNNTDVVKLIEQPEKIILRRDDTINIEALRVFIDNEAISSKSLEKVLDKMYTNTLTEVLQEVDIYKLPSESAHDILNKYAFNTAYIDEEQAEVISDLLITFEVDPDLYFDGDNFDKNIKNVLYDKPKTAALVNNF